MSFVETVYKFQEVDPKDFGPTSLMCKVVLQSIKRK
jgi:hypothetical protein